MVHKKAIKARNSAVGKRGSEAVETSLVSIGLLLISAVLVVIFVFISSAIFNLITKKEAQSTQESFNLLVSKLEQMDKSVDVQEAAHAYYIQDGYQLFGFNNDPDEIRHIRSNDPVVKASKMCASDKACVCTCDDSMCKGKVVECNKATNNRQVEFKSIKYFVVKNDVDNKYNQGKPIVDKFLPNYEKGGVNKYLAIFGKWGTGLDIGPLKVGVHQWPPGKIIYLVRNGEVVEMSFDKPAGFGEAKK